MQVLVHGALGGRRHLGHECLRSERYCTYAIAIAIVNNTIAIAIVSVKTQVRF